VEQCSSGLYLEPLSTLARARERTKTRVIWQVLAARFLSAPGETSYSITLFLPYHTVQYELLWELAMKYVRSTYDLELLSLDTFVPCAAEFASFDQGFMFSYLVAVRKSKCVHIFAIHNYPYLPLERQEFRDRTV
jgi:hypothetical protein